jgi:hypothetical protein
MPTVKNILKSVRSLLTTRSKKGYKKIDSNKSPDYERRDLTPPKYRTNAAKAAEQDEHVKRLVEQYKAKPRRHSLGGRRIRKTKTRTHKRKM